MFAKALKRVSSTAAVSLLAAGSALALCATPAYASSGRVTCATSAVVGMWVDVENGTDGWATLSNTSDPTTKGWSYNTQNRRWRVFVGCGGTSQNWGQSISSDFTSLQGTRTISCSDTGYVRKCIIG